MRHFYLLLAVALTACFTGIGTTLAVPAKPGPIKVTQSDGTQLTIRIYGDEFYHYTRSEEGYTLTVGTDGDYYFADVDTQGQLVSTGVKAKPMHMLTAPERQKISTLQKGLRPVMTLQQKQMRMAASHTAPAAPRADGLTPPGKLGGTRFNPFGKQRGLIILVEFSDLRFRTPSPQTAFTRLLNEDGYNENGATGSAWNYYHDNSRGLFDPEFVVVGPYTLSHNRKYYYPSSQHLSVVQSQMIPEACQLADADVDFSQFAEGGVIRDIFIFFAGGNEADGSDRAGIWPHRSSVYSGNYFDGAELNGYACSSELSRYTDGIKLTAIGTFCHEFGHVLGWPDFYDTDNKGSGGEAPALESFSLMCSGSYNNDSRTPPSLNILERWMVGWTEPEEITENGTYSLAPVSDNKGYLVQTPTANDYFLLENRDTRNNKWDLPLNSAADCRGLLVYHVDYTSRYAPLWSYNTLNNNPAHECMKLVRSVPGESSYHQPQRTFFPGSNNVTTLSSDVNADYISWNRERTLISFSDIKLDGSQVRLSVKTKAALKARVLANQYDALLMWEGNPAAEWKIVWKSAETQNEATVTGNNTYHINGLSPSTQYTVTVTQVSDTIESSTTLTFETEPSYTYRKVRLIVADTGYTHIAPILLGILDYPGTIGRIDWYIDNQKTENTYTTLEAGEHSIMAVITDADTQAQQYIVKYITVN